MAADTVGATARGTARAPLELGPAALVAETADGLSAAVHYGEPTTEYRVLGQGCGLVDRLWVEHLELTGEDRGRFLNGMVTGDTRLSSPAVGASSFSPTPRAGFWRRLGSWPWPTACCSRFRPAAPGRIAEHLSRYIVADRVELAPRPEMRALSLVGPDAWAVVARLAAGAPMSQERWSSLQVEWGGGEVSLAREERLGAPAITVHVAAAGEALALAARAASAGGRRGGAPGGFRGRRGAAGRGGPGALRAGLRPGLDAGRFPQEVGETDALDFEKGCYLGQEVVARIHYRGKVNHRLCGLRLGRGELPAPGSTVELDGDDVGRSGSAARSPGFAERIALAVLHRRAESGAVVDVAGVSARVVDLPFATG